MSFHYIHYTTTTTIHLSYSILSLKLPPPPRAVLLVNACLSTVHELEDGHTAPGLFPVGASGALLVKAQNSPALADYADLYVARQGVRRNTGLGSWN
jgi:hypothetical protein